MTISLPHNWKTLCLLCCTQHVTFMWSFSSECLATMCTVVHTVSQGLFSDCGAEYNQKLALYWTVLEGFHKPNCELVARKYHRGKACTLRPVGEVIFCFLLFFFGCCLQMLRPRKQMYVIEETGSEVMEVTVAAVWPERLLKKSTFLCQHPVWGCSRWFVQPVARLASCSSTQWRSSISQTPHTIYLSTRASPDNCYCRPTRCRRFLLKRDWTQRAHGVNTELNAHALIWRYSVVLSYLEACCCG